MIGTKMFKNVEATKITQRRYTWRRKNPIMKTRKEYLNKIHWKNKTLLKSESNNSSKKNKNKEKIFQNKT
jgi:hypothetical protein